MIYRPDIENPVSRRLGHSSSTSQSRGTSAVTRSESPRPFPQYDRPLQQNPARSSRSPARPNPLQHPQHSHSRRDSPGPNQRQTSRVTEIFCAWCTENGRPHQHTTAQCQLMETGSVHDRWKATQKHGICKNCLIEPHSFTRCPKSSQSKRCDACRYTHSLKLGCCPPELSRLVGSGL